MYRFFILLFFGSASLCTADDAELSRSKVEIARAGEELQGQYRVDQRPDTSVVSFFDDRLGQASFYPGDNSLSIYVTAPSEVLGARFKDSASLAMRLVEVVAAGVDTLKCPLDPHPMTPEGYWAVHLEIVLPARGRGRSCVTAELVRSVVTDFLTARK